MEKKKLDIEMRSLKSLNQKERLRWKRKEWSRKENEHI